MSLPWCITGLQTRRDNKLGENKSKFVLFGLLASISLLAFYFIISSIFGGFNFAIENFIQLWYWMVPLIIGFGLQIGMFFYVKEEMHKKAMAEAATSTGISTTSMIACCAHHISDIAPFLGITALGLFLTKYQSTFLLGGILSNILGITYMASMTNIKFSKSKLRIVFYSLLIISIVAVSASYFYISRSEGLLTTKQNPLQTLTSNKNNVEFSITPLSTSEFDISINTHSVSLGFDLKEISKLEDNLGNLYKPVSWDGAPPGGHHRSGTLKFQQIDRNAKSIKLTITDSTAREFTWDV